MHAPTFADYPEALTIADACALARISKSSIYYLIADGRLKARKLGRRTLILRADLVGFLAALPETKQVLPEIDAKLSRVRPRSTRDRAPSRRPSKRKLRR